MKRLGYKGGDGLCTADSSAALCCPLLAWKGKSRTEAGEEEVGKGASRLWSWGREKGCLARNWALC